MTIKDLYRKDNPFDYIVLGFIIKFLGTIAGLVVSYQIADALFGMFSWILIIKGFSKIPGKLHFPFGKRYQLLLSFYLFLCLIMIIRGYLIDYQYPWISYLSFINIHLFTSTYWICYLMPFAALIPLRYFNFRLMVNYSIIVVVITVVLFAIYYKQIVLASAIGAMGMAKDAVDLVQAQDVAFYGLFAFLPLFCYFIPKRKWQINMLGLFIMALLMVLGARRGGSMLMVILFLASLYFYTQTKSSGAKFRNRILIIFIILVAGYYLINSSLTAYILERGLEDTRSGVEEAVLQQMDTFELIFGKGLNGRYYYPMNDKVDHFDGWRYGVETGFYNIVLKGGYLMAFTYILLLAIPAYKGLFKSKNLFCKAGGFYILYSLFSLWPFGILSFDLSFLFIWMMVSCCMNRKVLKMSNEEIKKYFFYNLK